MKKYFFFAAAAIVAASCAKTPAPVQTPDGPEAPAVEGQVAVQFGTNVVANVETKASVDEWNGQELYIFGFPRISTGIDYNNPYINNVQASAPLKDAANNKINVYDADKSGGNVPYYYQGTTTYDFFGYYVQDAGTPSEADINASEDAYELAITIDGTQDIMTAKADVQYAVEQRDDSKKALGDDWDNKYAFSAYAARRGVQPILKFKHELTQLIFKVKSGTTFDTNNQLYITDVTINNVPVNATLCVAGANAGSDTGAAVTITDQKDGEGKYTNSISLHKDDDNIINKTNAIKVPSLNAAAENVGQPVMLFPEESKYSVTVTVAQGNADSDITAEIPLEVKVSDSTPFKPGFAYTVTFTLYGLESIDVTAELTNWQSGGEIEIDTDEKPTV